MPQVVEVPGFGDVEFPDDMSDDQIAQAIKTNMSPQTPRRFGSGKSFDAMEGSKLVPSADVHYSGGGVVPASSGLAQRERQFGPGVGMSAMDKLKGDAGSIGSHLTPIARGGYNALAAIPSLAADFGVASRNLITGSNYELPSVGAQRTVDQYLPLPNVPGDKTLEFGTSLLGGFKLPMPTSVSGAVTPEKIALTAGEVPTTEALKSAANATYKAADEAGVVIKPESTQRVVAMIQRVADSDNLGKLPPKIKEASDVLVERVKSGKPLSLADADKVRQLINDAKKSTDAADQRLARIIQGQYDDYLANLKPEDTLAGNAPQGVAILERARGLYQRQKNSELLDSMERKAAITGEANYSQAGTEHALRKQFEALAKNDKKMKMLKLSPAQQAAIEKVAAPGFTANALRNAGKFDPLKGGVPAFMANTLGGVAGGVFGGPEGAIAGSALVGGISHLANRGAQAVTRGNVAGAREALVGRGVPSLDSLLAKQPAQPLTGELMPRAPLALPAPNIVSGARSAPGTTYAREQMGLTPDVESAGLLHPGMARESVPPRPLALPHIPDTPPAVSPMVVDPRGRVAPNASALDEYLRVNGLDRMRNVRQPAANPPGLLEVPQSSGLLGTNRPSARPSREIQADIRRLAQQVRSVLKDKPAGSPEAQRVLAELRELQLELEASQAGR